MFSLGKINKDGRDLTMADIIEIFNSNTNIFSYTINSFILYN